MFDFCRDFIKTNQGNANIYSTQMDSGLLLSTTMPENLLPMYQSPFCEANKASMNKQAESGLTYNNISAPRKRPRDQLINDFNNFSVPQKTKMSVGASSFVDQDIAFQMQQQQSEIDRFIAQHVSLIPLPSFISTPSFSSFFNIPLFLSPVLGQTCRKFSLMLSIKPCAIHHNE